MKISTPGMRKPFKKCKPTLWLRLQSGTGIAGSGMLLGTGIAGSGMLLGTGISGRGMLLRTGIAGRRIRCEQNALQSVLTAPSVYALQAGGNF